MFDGVELIGITSVVLSYLHRNREYQINPNEHKFMRTDTIKLFVIDNIKEKNAHSVVTIRFRVKWYRQWCTSIRDRVSVSYFFFLKTSVI